MPQEETSIQSRLASVEQRIERALERSGRQRPDVTLVAVSKKFSASAIEEAYAAGLRHFGENYVQEFAEKKPGLTGVPDARFHLIGHLQSNKARLAQGLFDVIQTVDSVKLLERLEAAAAEKSLALEVLLEVKMSGEASKAGAAPEEIPGLLRAAEPLRFVRVTGLMTIPEWSEISEEARPVFRRLAELARQYSLPKVSMGMSGDFEVAIEEGATMIRIGTALFGARPKLRDSASALLT